MSDVATKHIPGIGDKNSTPNGLDTSKVKEAYDNVKQAAKNQSAAIADEASALARKGAAQVETAHGAATKAVLDNPLLAVGAALGVGVLLGLALRNRDRNQG